ncbi:lysophospholipid acyltransferase family protein [Miltoncostaea oceani]|uniref:lysophospholipid acyltransferase family protein n=1 Tax=Miltoncostaea oceani TaxID=2843216 RepID=UPI001C3E5005|nr:lysophospholipid acyltransferase family protein [Miltoncostaea oceani]
MIDRVMWALAHVIVLPLLYLPPLRMRRRGTEHLPRTGAVLLVCNHVSVADPLVLTAAARHRRTSMMAKAELFGNPFAAFLLRLQRAFPIRRGVGDVGAIRHALSLLDRGECLVVFPEGHVSRTGHMRRGHPGAGMFAQRPGVTVVPAVCWDTQLFRGPARVTFGPPVDVSDLTGTSRKARNREATDRIMTALCELAIAAGAPLQDPPVGPIRPKDLKRGFVDPDPVVLATASPSPR